MLFVDAKPLRLPTPSGENRIASRFNHLKMEVFRRQMAGPDLLFVP